MTSIESSKRLREVKHYDVVRRVTVEYRYSVRCDNARQARQMAERAFEQTAAGSSPYRQHIGHNVVADFVRSHTKTHDIGSSDFEQDDAGKLTICECEHADHFRHYRPEHEYRPLVPVDGAEQVTTSGGTFVFCAACREAKHGEV